MHASEIELDDIWPTLQQPVLLAFDNATRKRLVFVPSERQFHVRVRNDIEYAGDNIHTAIEIYNDR